LSSYISKSLELESFISISVSVLLRSSLSSIALILILAETVMFGLLPILLKNLFKLFRKRVSRKLAI
jgi:hypothetical protein